MAPCNVSFFEPDIQNMLICHKPRDFHMIHLRIPKQFMNQNEAHRYMEAFMAEKPCFSAVYKWTGECWKVQGRYYSFKFVSKTLMANDPCIF